MVTYTDRDRIIAGVPLGGIGAGKLEFDNKIRIVNVTITHNWNNPIKLLRGFHIYLKEDGEEKGRVLQKDSGLTRVPELNGEIIYEGRYPFVNIRAKLDNEKIVEIEAFSPIIPHDLKDSTLPAVGISIKVKGSKKGIIALSFPNIIGTTTIGRIDEKVNGGVVHKNLKANNYDPAKGDATIISPSAVAIIAQYNLRVKPSESIYYWAKPYENESPWLELEKGEIPKDDVHEVQGLRDEPASIIVAEYREGEEVRFVYSWYMTGKHVFYPYGHYYYNFFKDSYEIAKYFLDDYDELREKSKGIESLVPKDLPEWLRDAIINSNYTLSSSSIIDERGRFSLYEAPERFPVLGTIGTCYDLGSLPVLLMFPELERSFLALLSSYIREDGYIPHDLGYNSLDSPIDGTTSPPKWKDLNPTFILLVYRYYKFTKDEKFVRQVYPTMVKAMKWEFEHCKDGLPYLEGEMDTAFDALIMKGHDSYTSSIYIASLLAMRDMAKIVGDEETLKVLEEKIREARESFDKMFNGKYFKAADNLEGSFMAQILGEWWTTLLGLDSISSEDKIMSALNYILKLNGNASKYCSPNLVTDEGKIVTISGQTYSSWPRLVFAISWLGYRKGIKEFLGMAEKEWRTIVANGMVWDQPSRIDARTGKPDPPIGYLDHYIGSASIWSFLF
ncbi:MAG: GH116 family glycosyl hydrolase [Sulfolobaceae archaeon]|nr:GH116 family glycosyl hydrolase [Sulfolobaceae archaeon]